MNCHKKLNSTLRSTYEQGIVQWYIVYSAAASTVAPTDTHRMITATIACTPIKKISIRVEFNPAGSLISGPQHARTERV